MLESEIEDHHSPTAVVNKKRGKWRLNLTVPRALACCFSVGRVLSALRALQFLSHSQDAACHACDGSRDHRPRLGASGAIGVTSWSRLLFIVENGARIPRMAPNN